MNGCLPTISLLVPRWEPANQGFSASERGSRHDGFTLKVAIEDPSLTHQISAVGMV
jgi:hypothetical protein